MWEWILDGPFTCLVCDELRNIRVSVVDERNGAADTL